MSVTIERVRTRQVREERWNEFLASLKPWELHQLTKDEQELVLHDAYVNSETTIKAIRLSLSFTTTDNERASWDEGDPRG